MKSTNHVPALHLVVCGAPRAQLVLLAAGRHGVHGEGSGSETG